MPALPFDKLSTPPNELSTPLDKPGTPSDELGMLSNKPRTLSDKLGTPPDKLSSSSDKLGTRSNKLSTSPDKLGALLDRLSTAHKELGRCIEKPSALNVEEPNGGSEGIHASFRFLRHSALPRANSPHLALSFQDIRMWPPLTVATAQQLVQSYHRPLIVPMTLANPGYFDAIRAGFSTIAPVYHFCLVASLPTIKRRLQTRGDGPGSWTWRKAEQYVPCLYEAVYATHLDTEQHDVVEIVGQILARL